MDRATMTKTAFVASVVFCAFSAVVFAVHQSKIAAWKGKKLPSFSMKTVDGKTITNSTYKGKVLVIDFWATWCAPCRKASPTFQALHAKFASKDVVVLGADVLEEKPSASHGKQYAAQHKYTYTFTTGGDSLHKSLGATGVPLFVFVDKKGVIREIDGAFDESKDPARFNALVAKLAAE